MDKFIELDEAAGQTKFVKLDKFIALDGAKKLRPKKEEEKVKLFGTARKFRNEQGTCYVYTYYVSAKKGERGEEV